MEYRKIFILISILFLSISCYNDDIADQISYQILEKDHMSYSDMNKISKQYKIFETYDKWSKFIPQIEQVHPSTAERLNSLDFDFDTYNLGIVIGEFYSSCCSEITIESVYKKNRRIKIEFSESGPGIATALSQAYLILEIEKID